MQCTIAAYQKLNFISTLNQYPQVKKIAFKNFRRFQDFPELELGRISIMVGRNNSGKSTMVKALLLVLDYLQNQQFNEFSFAKKSLEDANIVTFGRAKNNKSKDNDEIIFELALDQFKFSLSIYGNDDDTISNVSKLLIEDSSSNINFEINYIEEVITVSKFNQTLLTKSEALGDVMKEFKEVGLEIQKPDFKKTSTEGLRMLDQFNKLKDRVQSYYEAFENEREETESTLFTTTYPLKLNIDDKTENSFLQEFVSDLFFQNDVKRRSYSGYLDDLAKAIEAVKESKIEAEKEFNNKKIEKITNQIDSLNLGNQTLSEKVQELIDIDNYRSDLTRSIGNVVKAIEEVKIYYLGSNPSKQSALFSIRDKQNNLAQAIHDFKQSKILKGEKEYEFVKFWMKEFDVGQDFEIKFYAGEAYEFFVIDKEGFKTHLADKGMGSLQAMMLILRVATIMRKHNKTMKYVTIIVEEPELNLHPTLQSKLASFFHTVNREYGIEFIIETHSEYLIRKAQLFVVENEYTNLEGLNPNPFSVNYFDVENGPYQMNFTENGKFDRNFGEGFYDEASKNTLALMQKQRKRN